MSEPKLKVLVVVGSTHATSVTRVVLSSVAEDLRKQGCEVDVLDLSKEPLALFNVETAYSQPGFAALKARVELRMCSCSARPITTAASAAR